MSVSNNEPASDRIVKIQRALFPLNGPALVYDQDRSMVTHVPVEDLPEPVRHALKVHDKVYWRVVKEEAGGFGGLLYLNQAEAQSW